MATLKRRPAHTDNLVLWTWTAVALTLVGWFWGALAIAYSHLGDVTDVSMMTGGVVLFAEAPAAAVVLAIHAARAGQRSGRIAVVVSGLLLLATIVVLTLVAVLIQARSRNKPPPSGPDGAQHEEGSPAAPAQPGTSGRPS